MFEKKVKCDVCGYRFIPEKSSVYVAEKPLAPFAALTSAPEQFSMIDCPRCSCQIMLGLYYPRVDCPLKDLADLCETDDPEDELGEMDD